MYGLTFLELYGIISAVKRAPTHTNVESNCENMYNLWINEDHIARKAYAKLTLESFILEGKIKAWEKELHMEIEYEQFLNLIKSIYVVTNITKYRSFQYRLLMRAIVTNIHLKRWGMIESDNCTFCNKESETYSHLFIFCEKTKQLWLDLEQWFNSLSSERICFGTDTVIANRLMERPSHLFNFLCLLLKQYIYKKRCLNQNVSFREFKLHANKIKNVENLLP